jgi:hypothetical protein
MIDGAPGIPGFRSLAGAARVGGKKNLHVGQKGA